MAIEDMHGKVLVDQFVGHLSAAQSLCGAASIVHTCGFERAQISELVASSVHKSLMNTYLGDVSYLFAM